MLKLVASLLLIVVGFFILQTLQSFHWADFLASLSHFHIKYLLLSLACVVAQVLCQMTRLWVVAFHVSGLVWRHAAWAFTLGQSVNTFVPARAWQGINIEPCRNHAAPQSKPCIEHPWIIVSLIPGEMHELSIDNGFFRASLQIQSTQPYRLRLRLAGLEKPQREIATVL